MLCSDLLTIHRDRIREIAVHQHCVKVQVFGSVARGEETAESDIDFLVTPTEKTTLIDIGALRVEYRQLLGREVDVLTPGALPPEIRERVLREAREI
ncbi:nucleotidyltransferase family protein [Ramlibacter sp. GTP1]|uniref:Nucleotidyltransferase family protein n=1 Tax=Ramlibacter albus TaxID=2079448 RepID=A0A923MC26_9BURK|nr:nucleotidyltransferase family protein [Ramlibacter albus]